MYYNMLQSTTSDTTPIIKDIIFNPWENHDLSGMMKWLTK